MNSTDNKNIEIIRNPLCMTPGGLAREIIYKRNGRFLKREIVYIRSELEDAN